MPISYFFFLIWEKTPDLSSQDEDEPVPPQSPKTRKRKPRKDNLPDDLPVEEVIIDPDEVQENPKDYRCIGEDVHEELEVYPIRFVRRKIIRRKYVKIDDREAPFYCFRQHSFQRCAHHISYCQPQEAP